MAWKPEYAARRRAKYQSDPDERERRRAQSRSPEDNRTYMQAYYEANKPRWQQNREQQAPERNRRRRERYAADPAFRERAKQWARNRSPVKRRDGRLRSTYGIDLATYNRMLAEQDGRCAICGGDAQLYVDHCHRTGVVRGLLCAACNFGLGKFRDDPDALRRAAAYIEASQRP